MLGQLASLLKSSLLKKKTEQKIIDLGNRLVVAKGEGEGVGWLRSLGLIDTNYCLWKGLSIR